MLIEITGELETKVKEAMAAGEFATPQALLVYWLNDMALTQSLTSPVGMPVKLDPDALAAKQGIGPVTDFRQMKFDDWPEGESVEDFLAGIYELRGKKWDPNNR